MKKHIKGYFEVVNESVGKGSIVLIKGKSDRGKKKLFAAQVSGSSEIRPGATMLFLSNEFYRIKQEGDKLKAVKVAYRDDAELKNALNLKSPGKISIVKNNSKTPLHWKTLKHTSIDAVLRELQDSLQPSEYLLESNTEFNIPLWNQFLNLAAKKFINTLFFGKSELYILSYSTEGNVESDAIEKAHERGVSTVEVEWEAEFEIMFRDRESREILKELGIKNKLRFDIFFTSTVEVSLTQEDSGDYYQPPYWRHEVTDFITHITDMYCDGDAITESDEELTQLYAGMRKKVKEFDQDKLRTLVDSVIKDQLFF